MSLVFHAGFDFMRSTGSGFLDARSHFSRLGWVDFPTGAAAFAVSFKIESSNTPYSYGKCLGIDTLVNAISQISRPFPDYVSRDEVFIGARMFCSNNVARTLEPYLGASYFGTRTMRVMLCEFGVIQVRNATGLLFSSPPGQFTDSTWNYIELGFKLTDDTTGWMTVRVNGKPIVQLVDQVTSSALNLLVNMVTVGYRLEAPVGWGGDRCLWDDLYVTDPTGPRNNGFLGTIRVQALLPDGDSLVSWNVEPNTNQNWESARNELLDNSAFVFSDVVDDQDKYTIEPMVNTPEVFGVQVTGLYRQNDATQRSVANVIDSNGTEAEGQEYFTPGNYAASIDQFEVDPDTGISWLPSAVNALLVGPKVKS